MTPTERLSLLADKLEQNANNPKGMKFDLSNWFLEEGLVPQQDLAIDCGTTGCAIGLALLTPELNQEGFNIDDFGPRFDGYCGWDSVREFFGLTAAQASRLFTDFYYPITKGAKAELMVAAKIREFIKTGEVP